MEPIGADGASCDGVSRDNVSSDGVSARLREPGGRDVGQPRVPVRIRRFTYPFKSAMAICSDLDETPDRGVYLDIARYLNTREATSMGRGVGLEAGNSVFFDMPDNQFSYWGTDDAGREMVRTMIGSGHVDCLHSYGDFASTRDVAKRVIDELNQHGCRFEVWVDHSKSPSNFGPDIMVGHGDESGHEAYHADLTIDYGIRYVWRGRTTGVTGQDNPIGFSSFAHFIDPKHPIGTARTAMKEAVKVRLGRRGHPRWEMYGANELVRSSRLRDGQPIWEFLRSNPYWKGSGQGDTAADVGDVLTDRMLRRLVSVGGACIWYTHLGKVADPREPFARRARAGFERLAARRDAGDILVTTTHRLVRYRTVQESLRYAAVVEGETTVITLTTIDDAVFGERSPTIVDVQGLTFVVPRTKTVEVRLGDDRPISIDCVHQGDDTFVTIPWIPLEFPRLEG
jgi:hypothetical protein